MALFSSSTHNKKDEHFINTGKRDRAVAVSLSLLDKEHIRQRLALNIRPDVLKAVCYVFPVAWFWEAN